MREAFGHRSYNLLLVLGFFTCGFQLVFITVHLPAYLVDRGLSAEVGAWTIGVIGLFNIIGSIAVRLARRPHAASAIILAAIYFLRSLAIAVSSSLPASPAVGARVRRRHRACSGSPPCRRPTASSP